MQRGGHALVVLLATAVLAAGCAAPGSERSSEVAVRSSTEPGLVAPDQAPSPFPSPEALEEVFWRVLTGNQYINRHYLHAYQCNLETIEKFRAYIFIINITIL